jgi:NAD(P)-dependent dehydrogenase (short-subunit alcohol dehydrogenase family)
MSYSALKLNGKVAVVIGGTSGIGRAIAHGMAEAGADVVPTSRRMEQVEAAATEIEERGRRALRLASDVSERASLQHLLDESVRAFGKVDILVNCAGRTKRGPTLDFTEEDWDAIIETNLTGTLRACQVFTDSARSFKWLGRRFRRVLSVVPLMYDDIWTAAKGMYKLEPVVEDGGEVIIYAPHIDEISYTHGALLHEIGYHVRDYFLK